jgi:hypothetical protein
MPSTIRRIDSAAIDAAALAALAEVLDAILPMVRDHGSVYMSRDRRGTVTITKRTGDWSDNRGGENTSGRGIVALFGHLNKCDRAEAAGLLSDILGLRAAPIVESAPPFVPEIAALRAERQLLQDENLRLRAEIERLTNDRAEIEPVVEVPVAEPTKAPAKKILKITKKNAAA